MADKRKLQGEIDRCLKKVQEGVDTFEDIWQKVHSSANANQKEKYEADLKKEIKKLQRQRDHIKTWLACSDIKDKRALVENRKLIETQMERFKVVEKETKTKAYSKEGLGAALKLDPLAKEKQEVTAWLSQMIDNLNIQNDQFESEVEQLTSGNKKKKLDKDKNERFEQLKANQERHIYHIKKLETIMRMVDNETLPLEQIKSIREDIEYFVESNQDPDFEENDFIYEELELDELEAGLPSESLHDEDHLSDKLSITPTSTNSNSPSPSPGIGVNHLKDDDRKKYQEMMKNNTNALSSSSSSSSSSISSSGKVPATSTKLNSQSSGNLIENNIYDHLPNSSPPSHGWLDGQSSNSGSPIASRLQNNVPVSVWQRTTSSVAPLRQLNFTDYSSQSSEITKSQSNLYSNHVSILSSNVSTSILVNNSLNTLVNSVASNSVVGNPSIPPSQNSVQLLSNGHGQEPITLTSVYSAPSVINSNNNSIVTSLSSSQSLSMLPASSQSNNAIIAMNTLNTLSSPNTTSKAEILSGVINGPINAGGMPHKDSLSDSLSSLKTIAQQALVKTSSQENQIPSTSESHSTFTKVPSYGTLSQQSPQQQCLMSQDNIQTGPEPPPLTTTIHLNRLLGVAPLGPVPIVKDHLHQLTMGEAAFYHLPHPSDSERLRHYLPRNPCPTPLYYPQLLPPHLDSVEFFQILSTETLFFIFYYMEGTKAQYLAAKALKKQSWRFHTKYLMWFQRHEEPKTINEDYEQGTYIYFDYEKWGQRKKDSFTFEYRYLEDRDLN